MADARKNRLDTLQQLFHELDTEWSDAMAELKASREGMGGDDDVESVTQSLAMRLDQIFDHRREVAEAIERLSTEEGATCEGCGESIPPARLEANPTAVRCVACQRRAERT